MSKKKEKRELSSPKRQHIQADEKKKRFIRFFILSLLTIFVLVLVLFSLYFPLKYKSDRKSDLNVLLITVDTLRADYLGCYGNERVKTPALDGLAKNGIKFDSAFAHNVITLPSHVNILTGTYPIFHGVRENIGFRVKDETLTLAEILKKNGYKTGAFIGAFPLDSRFGLDKGFDVYDDNYGDSNALNDFSFAERKAEDVIRAAISWTDFLYQNEKLNSTQASGQRWFCWVHIFDPHAPYNPPQEFKDRHPENLYSGEVEYTDTSIGLLIEYLKKSGYEKDTLIVITSDHGESLGEHGERTHGIFAYNSTLHIPLIFYNPSVFREARSISKMVRHIDIVPTILDLLDIRIPDEIQGSSLVSLLENPSKSKWKSKDCYFESMTANLDRNWAPLKGVISDQFKYIDLPLKELYDIQSDYKEENNLVGKEISLMNESGNKLDECIRKYSVEKNQKIIRIEENSETLEKLRSLGYIGPSEKRPAKKIYSVQDDPKNLIYLDTMLHEAMGNFLNNDYEKAIHLLEKVLELRPDFYRIYANLSFIYHEMGELQKSVETLKKAMELNLENPDLLVRLGIYLQEIGSVNQSVEILESLIKQDPQNIDVLNFLGMGYWRQGNSDKAAETFERLLSLKRNFPSAYNNLGAVYLGDKKYDLAYEMFKEAIRLDPKLSGAYNGLGVVYVNREDYDNAVESWKKAISLDRKQYDALFNLGILLVRLGRFDEAVPYLEQFVKAAPAQKYGKDIPKVEKLIEGISSAKR